MCRPPTTPRSCYRCSLIGALPLAVLLARIPAAADDPDFASAPPLVRTLAIQLIDRSSERARLLVEYGADERLPPRLSLNFGREMVVLRDDGEDGDQAARDRIYTGTFSLDVPAFLSHWRHAATLTQHERTVPVFDGREVVGHHVVPPVVLQRFKADLREQMRILVDKQFCCLYSIDWRKSLFITSPKVVRNKDRTYDRCRKIKGTPNGTWSFGHLIREAAGGPSVSDAAVSAFIKNWLGLWVNAQTVNGWNVAPRTKITERIIDPWKQASTGSGMEFDPAQAPFRLLAIVNRVDLSDALVYGRSGVPVRDAELRFVFGAMSKDCVPLKFTVIFEYGLGRTDCQALGTWARDWVDLSPLPFGLTYYQKLESLTEQVVKHGSAASRPNKSWLNQIRTNELSLDDPSGGSVWDMREFRLNDVNQLFEDTVKQTPDGSLNGSTRLRDYINANSADIAADHYEVPSSEPAGQSFLGGQSLAKPTPGVWNAPGITSNAARSMFSRNTCGGCHARETDTDATHVNPMVNPGAASQLSGFLTGSTVIDPVDGASHQFADLDRRACELGIAANLDCVCQLYHTTLSEPH